MLKSYKTKLFSKEKRNESINSTKLSKNPVILHLNWKYQGELMIFFLYKYETKTIIFVFLHPFQNQTKPMMLEVSPGRGRRGGLLGADHLFLDHSM